MPEYYSLEEVANRLGKTEDDVKNMVSQGALRAFRDAGTLKFRRADIDSVAPAPTGKSDAKGPADKAAVTPEPDQDELLFLIDEEGTPGESDDLTLIGEEEQTAAAEAESQGAAAEVPVEGGEGEADDEALTAVMPAPGAGTKRPVKEAPAPDIFAEAQEDMGAGQDVEAEPVGATVSLPAGRVARLQQLQQQERSRSPFMTVLLVLTFLILIGGGVVIYNMFVDSKPQYIVSLLQSVKIP